jgi:type II secretory pathway component GspD/PulD (secretin)
MRGHYPEIYNTEITEKSQKIELNSHSTGTTLPILPRILTEVTEHVTQFLTTIFNYSYDRRNTNSIVNEEHLSSSYDYIQQDRC